ncbi:MAG: uncharacterized membrane protein YuzA (DUF378 family) [Candidatus Paceibacteria bacterium]|jgi:uncharacterized membrane protein YuzA (DUF378 family)
MMKKTAMYLTSIGALNWGLVGVAGFFGSNWNLVNLVFGGIPTLEFIVYILIGLSAIYSLCVKKDPCSDCAGGSCDVHGKKA